ALFLVVLVAVQAFIAFWRILLFAKASERSLASLRRDTFSRIIRLPMATLGARRVGELASRLANDVESMRETLVVTIPQAIRHTVILVGGVVLVFILSVKLALFMMATVPVVLVLIAVFGTRIRKLTRKAQDDLAASQVVVDESLQSIVSVKAFCNEAYEIARYDKRLGSYLGTAIKAALPRASFIAFIIFCFSMALVAVTWFAANMVASGEMDHKRLANFGLFSGLIGASFMQMSELITQIQRTLGATERVREILSDDCEASDSTQPPSRLQGDIAMESVNFFYPSRPEALVLQDFNLSMKAGQRVALVGPSGSGKTTTVSLLFRFYEPTAGRILFDGKPAGELPLHTLRKNLALVPQEVLLFGDSIRENIAYGRPGATEAEIREAAQKANAHEFIDKLPQGYDTLVGDRGAQLSGGQRQRIAIARAILADPAILILDEATSSLDAESERLVQDALDKLMENRTSIIIAHRLSTVRRCDQILVLSAGTVIERGTHEELVANSGSLYATLARLQLE
ncbi:MAG TPA: ABC transporter transmembrane domain-containing protein, partial [Anaerolineae bacterium]|nr:ABC transporter transmembrane domain-containing protein [Anaerolineae bacterium]